MFSLIAETIFRRADTLKAAWTAAEIVKRLVKVGGKNWAVTDAVNKVTAAWDVKAVEGESTPSPDGAVKSYRFYRHAFMPAGTKPD